MFQILFILIFFIKWGVFISLDRFISKQEIFYETAFKEISNGKKESHYMWYIFPQIDGLVKNPSSTSKKYAIKDLEEAREYIQNEYLRNNLVNISSELLKLDTDNPVEIFGSTDSKKLKSSMTLFEFVSDEEVFSQVLEKYYSGKRDERTLKLLN